MTDTTAAALLAAMLGTLALLVLVGAFVFSRALGRAGAALRLRDERLVAQAVELPERFHDARLRLGEFHAWTGHALWSLSRLEQRIDATRVSLVTQRAGLDRSRERIIGARAEIERIKRGARMVMRALELRRTFLG
ncbi:MAG: hypothetical protein ABI797_00290 [Chloroflexota bacterium]